MLLAFFCRELSQKQFENMKKLYLSLVCVVACLFANSAVSSAQAEPSQYKFMTMNLRCLNGGDPFPWNDRAEAICKFLNAEQPDVFGTQEGSLKQLDDIKAGASQYSWVGEGRDGALKGEFMAIFYKKDRFVPLSVESKWLSETPDVPGSKYPGAGCTRMVTIVRFVDRTNNKEFIYANTHLDHISEEARVNGSRVLVSAVNDVLKLHPLPAILTADFNTHNGGPVYKFLTKENSWNDTWVYPGQEQNDAVNTYQGWKMPKKSENARIDWILTKPEMKVFSSKIVLPEEGKTFLSDHCPVISVVEMP